MSFKVNVFKIAERNDKTVIDVMFFKISQTMDPDNYIRIGTEFSRKVTALTDAIIGDCSLLLSVAILGPHYEPTASLAHYTVSFTAICPKQKKDLLISRIKEEAQKQNLEFGETQKISIP